MLDTHCHILFGVDDGAENRRMAYLMLSSAKRVGIGQIVATPHVWAADINRALIAERARVLAEMAAGFHIALRLGYELNMRVYPALSPEAVRSFCIEGTDSILIEFENELPFPYWERAVGDMVAAGLRPIVAHPERYFWAGRAGVYERMIELGCRLQVDAGSLCAGWLDPVRANARRLIERGMAHFVASDAHRPEDYRLLEGARRVRGVADLLERGAL